MNKVLQPLEATIGNLRLFNPYMPEPFFQGICFMLETWILVSFLGEFNLTFKHFICLFEVWLRYLY